MFSLIYGALEALLRKDELRVLVLGLDGAGKTNVLERLKAVYGGGGGGPGLEPSKILPTVGLNVGRLEAGGAALVVWDLGGAPGLRPIWERYFDEAHALVYVVDAACAGRLDEAKLAMERVLGSQALHDAPLLVLANKQDAAGAAAAAAVADHLGVGKVDSRPVRVQGTSAVSGEGLVDGVSWLVNTARRGPRAARLRYR